MSILNMARLFLTSTVAHVDRLNWRPSSVTRTPPHSTWSKVRFLKCATNLAVLSQAREIPTYFEPFASTAKGPAHRGQNSSSAMSPHLAPAWRLFLDEFWCPPKKSTYVCHFGKLYWVLRRSRYSRHVRIFPASGCGELVGQENNMGTQQHKQN